MLCVFLGGHDTDLNAVHLSRVRIADAKAAALLVVKRPSDSASAVTGTITEPTTPVLERARTGPSARSTDDLYVGSRPPLEGVTRPAATTPEMPSEAGTSPNTGLTTGGTNTRSTGEEGAIDELEVARRPVQGVTSPLTTTPEIPSTITPCDRSAGEDAATGTLLPR